MVVRCRSYQPAQFGPTRADDPEEHRLCSPGPLAGSAVNPQRVANNDVLSQLRMTASQIFSRDYTEEETATMSAYLCSSHPIEQLRCPARLTGGDRDRLAFE
jgi:hypothetical protein